MTKNEMKERIREIDKERNRLAEEKQSYEKLLRQDMAKEIIDEHRQHIGECYIPTFRINEKDRYIKAFKILEVSNEPNESYARCLVVVDGIRSNCWKESGVVLMTLGLWTYNDLRLMNRESDPKIIDCCRMISEDEFNALFKQYMTNIEDTAVGKR